MKKLLLLVPAIGMAANAFAQPEVSDKWVITPVTTMKGVLGRLDINFPADVERNILIYQQTDNKFLRSVSHNDKTYTIAPGEYRFTLTNVPVENVPIKKGHETRLKAGFLDIVSEGDWHLYDETKEKAYTSGNKPKKLPLPVGRYQIKLGGQFYPVIIKDGETVEDSSPVEVKNETPGKETSQIKEADPIIKQVNEQAKWVITPLPGSKGTPEVKESGKLDVSFPEGSWCTPITGCVSWWYSAQMNNPLWRGENWYMNISHSDNPDILLSSADFKEQEIIPGNKKKHYTYNLIPGEYQITLNKILVKNLPIQSGKETRIKTGLLKIACQNNNSVTWYGETSPFSWYLHDLQKPYHNYYFWGNAGAIIVLPVGFYGLRIWGAYPVDRIEVKDNEVICLPVEIHPLKIIADSVRWSLYDANGTFPYPYYMGGYLNQKTTNNYNLTKGNYFLKYNGKNGERSIPISIPLNPNWAQISISKNDD